MYSLVFAGTGIVGRCSQVRHRASETPRDDATDALWKWKIKADRRSELKLSNAYHVPGVMKNLLSVTDGKMSGPNLQEQLDLFEVSRVVVEMVDAVITFPFVAFLLSYIRILVMKMMDIYFIKLHSLFFKNTNEFLSTGGWYLVERLGVPQSKVYGPKNGSFI
ncbi:hypothetical protein E3N88_45066 [Mikania micrantha]|uniref:Uncharacterized protein n=1 Tax=Mikania micrantha TaxID=192012 RepID=A0A5N6LCK3_9ASTR|nr:hypothetical protein E3N88_45066 [Mikania micrantha]